VSREAPVDGRGNLARVAPDTALQLYGVFSSKAKSKCAARIIPRASSRLVPPFLAFAPRLCLTSGALVPRCGISKLRPYPAFPRFPSFLALPCATFFGWLSRLRVGAFFQQQSPKRWAVSGTRQRLSAPARVSPCATFQCTNAPVQLLSRCPSAPRSRWRRGQSLAL
jgi:hypothetical protein